ncbi:uncharacterized protein LOC143285666 [Babylonia areolata]|uniref:uncharacterized protein LOC143285666 n=1 Tax=Babylonia areolata TaxID=304850 RepID=UPI003FD13A6C
MRASSLIFMFIVARIRSRDRHGESARHDRKHVIVPHVDTSLICGIKVLELYVSVIQCHRCVHGLTQNLHTSAAMETQAAVIMFGRSVELHNFRYKHLLGDGDAKAHNAVNESAPYGDGSNVEKIECVNHVTKRMGTALQNLVEKQKAIKQPTGGRGKMTENKQLTNGGSCDGSLQLGTISTNDDPHHLQCPAGKDSWCFFRRAEADNQPPRPHTNPLPRDLIDALLPVYNRLGNPQLLHRCLAGKTQNSNECFHSMVWRTCPKEL